MILNIRGTSGSGKSTLTRLLMEETKARELRRTVKDARGKEREKIFGYEGVLDGKPVFFVGPYTSPCGGCDAVKTQDEVCDLVETFARQVEQGGHVVFEGLLVSGGFQRYVDLARKLSNHKWLFAFMDTPVDVCLRRIQNRRQARGDERPFNPENTIGRHASVNKLLPRFRAEGFRAEHVPHGEPLPAVLAWLRGA
jgi:predicted kinase